MGTANFRTMENFPLYVIEDSNDEIMDYEIALEVKDVLDELNDSLIFHNLSIVSGYYCGAQLFVKSEDDPHELDNEDCHYFYDMCRSASIRKYDSEINKVKRLMRNVAKDFGFIEIGCIGVASNGEAFYRLK